MISITNKDHDLVVPYVDTTKLEIRERLSPISGDLWGYEICTEDGVNLGLFDNRRSAEPWEMGAEEIVLAAQIIDKWRPALEQATGRRIKSFVVPGYSDSPEHSDYESARWSV